MLKKIKIINFDIVCKIIKIINFNICLEEQMRAKEFTKEAYVASLSLKTIRV